ncbi:hypothetical protein V5O48_018668, partial [Marasmius crinis-equi]
MLTTVWKTINTLTSPSLRSVAFNVSGSGFRVLDQRWDALDVLLASNKFASVAVELVIPFSNLTLDNGTENQDVSIARKVFSRCDEQGRLSVVRAPFVMKTRRWANEGGDEDDAEAVPDWEVIDW